MPNTPEASTFASALGQVVWLLTVSKDHKELPIRFVEERITPAILLQQFKIYMKGKQPVAFIAWAAVSEEIESRMSDAQYTPEVNDWRSGSKIVIVECVSPFTSKSEIIAQFKASDTSIGENI